MSGVRDETFSRAVIMYIWGDRSEPWPSTHPVFVTEHFGEDAAQQLPRVEALLAEIHQDPRPWFASDLAAMAARVNMAIRERHPELTDEAVEALVAHVTYTWK
jgi:hypothetical protein